MAAKTSAQISIETLTSLGAIRLAEILHEHTHDDPRLLEKLESALAEAAPVRAKRSRTMLGSIERRLAMLAEMDGYHDWRAAASVGADIDTIRQDIMESVLPEDPESAAGRLEQLVDLEHFLFETADDSDGEISGALRAVVDDWGRAWSSVANRDAETVAELVFDAFTENDYGVLDEVIPAFEEALGVAGLAALEVRFRAALEKYPKLTDGEDRDREWNQRMLFRGLEEIADLRGDVDAFIATHKAAGTHLVYAVAIAERLHRAGRSDEALHWLERPDRQRRGGENSTDLHIGVLEALGRRDDALAMRWQAFERTLAFAHYGDYREKTPEPDRDIVRQRAIDLALSHEHVHHALEFLIAVEALAEAEDLVLRRTTEFHGRDYWTLRPAAQALAPNHPTAAILLYRLLAEAVLNAGKSQYYRYGIGDLREAMLLSEGVDNWKSLEDHETFMKRLQAEHGRKRSFWKQW